MGNDPAPIFIIPCPQIQKVGIKAKVKADLILRISVLYVNEGWQIDQKQIASCQNLTECKAVVQMSADEYDMRVYVLQHIHLQMLLCTGMIFTHHMSILQRLMCNDADRLAFIILLQSV